MTDQKNNPLTQQNTEAKVNTPPAQKPAPENASPKAVAPKPAPHGQNAGAQVKPAIQNNVRPLPNMVAGVEKVVKKKVGYLQISKKLLWGVIAPFAIMAFYWGIWAADRFVGEAKVIVKVADSAASQMEGIAFVGAVTPTQRDALIVKEFIESWAMLQFIDQAMDIKSHYQSDLADMFSRLSSTTTRENYLSYYRSHIEVYFDEYTSVLQIKAQAFDPDTAKRLTEVIVERAEWFINEISNQLATDQMHFVDGELNRAKETLKQAKTKLIDFQRENNMFSPDEESSALVGLLGELESNLVMAQTEYKQLGSYMNENAPQMIAKRSQVDALKAQLEDERKRLIGSSNGLKTVNEINIEFQNLKMEIEFATDAYKTALISLEQSRIEAYRKLKHLVVVEPAVAQEEAEYPRRSYNLFTFLIFLLMIYGLVVMVVATVKEHRDA